MSSQENNLHMCRSFGHADAPPGGPDVAPAEWCRDTKCEDLAAWRALASARVGRSLDFEVKRCFLLFGSQWLACADRVEVGIKRRQR